MTKPPPPARLFILLAREAPVGVILRKGPTSWVQMIKWHTDTDQFVMGQWMKARVYENNCDLSPDGNLFIYLVRNGKGMRNHPDYGMMWTAISKPPYFTALALWPEHGTWRGGGRFLDNKTALVNVPKDSYHPNHPPRGIMVLDLESLIGLNAEAQSQQEQWEIISYGHDIREEYGALWTALNDDTSDSRLNVDIDRYQLLDVQMADKSMNDWLTKLDPPTIWRKSHTIYSLEQHYFGYRSGQGNVSKLFVVNNNTNDKFSLDRANWADFDQQGRLVLAKEGKLFAGTLENGELKLIELADFNGSKPDPQPAPDWAQKW
jgi:hypothetical protein